MKEAEWLREQRHGQGMLWCLEKRANVQRTKSGRRKLRLFACGCCQLIWEHIHDPRLRGAVEVAERFADNAATKAELAAAHSKVSGLVRGSLVPEDSPKAQTNTAASMCMDCAHVRPSAAAFGPLAMPMPLAGYLGGEKEGHAILCHLLRDVFRNPFRPFPVIDEAWQTSDVRRLAQVIYDSRDFSSLSMLSDALEEAGCDNVEILNHCRGPGPHVRGCWVVDLILGKS